MEGEAMDNSTDHATEQITDYWAHRGNRLMKNKYGGFRKAA